MEADARLTTDLAEPQRTCTVTVVDQEVGPRDGSEQRGTHARLLAVILVIGVALRVWAYAANTALWLDEILIARNILELPLGHLLTRPLQLDQVAPRGFLFVEKLAVLAFGDRELALRLFPFLCGIASLFLFRRLAERTLTGFAVPFAVALFALGLPFVTFAVQVKQYMVDATAAILLLTLALGLRREGTATPHLIIVGLTGAVISWFSQASVVVMAGIGVGIGIDWLVRRDRSALRVLLVTMPLWALAAVIAIVVGMKSMTPSTREFMDDFWRTGFFPLPLRSPAQLKWFWDQGLTVFTDPTLLRYRLPALYLVLAIAGMVVMWRRNRTIALVLLGPIAVALVAAVAHQYPFRGRLILYLVPVFVLAIGAAADWLRLTVARVTPAFGKPLGAAVMAALFIPPLVTIGTTLPPYEIDHTRTMLAHLQRNRQPGDVVHVFPLSRVGVLYYAADYDLTSDAWTTAACDRDDTRAYLTDVDRYRGAPRVWVLGASNRAFRSAHAAVRGYLSTIGVRRDGLARPALTRGQVTLDLYDLSDSTRLASAAAATFPVDPMSRDPRPGCRPWIRPSALDTALVR